MLERITTDPQIYRGQPIIKGTQIPVHEVLHMMADGEPIEQVLVEYPALSREDVLACLEYAARLAERLTATIEEFGEIQ